jgi:hypothetical protein
VVTFSYFPRTLKFSVPLALLTLVLLFGHARLLRLLQNARRTGD